MCIRDRALTTVLTNTELRIQMRASGIRRAQRFTYATTASQTISVYQRVVGITQGER